MLDISIYQKPHFAVRRPCSGADIEQALDKVAFWLNGETWLLGGGVSIALTLGAYYREHSDLDLVVTRQDLSAIGSRLKRNGYRLYTRKLMKHDRWGVLLQIPMPMGGFLFNLRPRRLCFIREQDSSGNIFLDKLDVYVYQDSGNHFTAMDGNIQFEKTHPLVGHRFQTANGLFVNCLHRHYVRFFSASRGGAKHQIDVIALDEGVEAARQRVRQILAGESRET